MISHRVHTVPRLELPLLLAWLASACLSAPATSSVIPQGAGNVVQQDRVIAGGPGDSLEVRHLVLAGTNEQIGRALAEIARERYGARLQASRDPLQARAQRTFLERNDPILLERMRGVAAAFGRSIDDDAWDFTALGFTELRAGCSIVHLPPACMASGKSVVSRDYDYSTGNLTFGFLPKGMLHATARPYLVELHPDRGYASIAMVAYDLLSGVLDGINSEGLVVTMAMDDELRAELPMEPTLGPAVGVGTLQLSRLLLDTCATVEEAKQTLMATKQYYEYVPLHYLIADRHGKAFVWEYSESHNKEYIVENPGEPLVMTNFTLHKRLNDGKPPAAAAVSAICKRYEFLSAQFAGADRTLDDQKIRDVHSKVDCQLSQAANPARPPIRTFWHAFYYPEDRRVRLSFYLRDEPIPDQPRLVRPIRTDYLEFKLAPTGSEPASAASPAAAARASAPTAASSATPAVGKAEAAIVAAGGTVKRDGERIVSVNLDKASQPDTVLPMLAQLPDLEELSVQTATMSAAGMRALQGLPKLHGLGLFGAPIDDDALAVVKTLPALRVLQIGGTRVTDAGPAHLYVLAALEGVGLKGTAVTDAGLVHLQQLEHLTSLNLADTKVTDAGLVHLAGMTRLETLNLSNDAVTDAGLEQVGRHIGITGLNLSGTKVTDAGLVHLQTLTKLTKLNLSATAVTQQGVADAKRFLPFWIAVTR